MKTFNAGGGTVLNAKKSLKVKDKTLSKSLIEVNLLMPTHPDKVEVITCKVPVMTDILTEKKLRYLQKLTARDTSIIKGYLEVIDTKKDELFNNKASMADTKAHLDSLTLTSRPLKRKNREGVANVTPGRTQVFFDMKENFSNHTSVRELKNCRDTAMEMYTSHLAAVARHDQTYWKFFENEKYDGREDMLANTLRWWMTKKPALPCQSLTYEPKKLPRRICTSTGKIHCNTATTVTKYWFEVYSTSKKKHLFLPLNVSEYHKRQFNKGKLTSYKLVYDSDKLRWYLHIGINIMKGKTTEKKKQSLTTGEVEQEDTVVQMAKETHHLGPPTVPTQVIKDVMSASKKPLAVFSIDFGMNRTATTSLTVNGCQATSADIKLFDVPQKKTRLDQLDRQIASLQREVKKRANAGIPYVNVLRKLKNLRHTRQQLSIQYDHELTAQIAQYCQELSQSYDLHVVMGNLKGIQNSRWKGDGKSRKHRKRLHRWAYQRITGFLSYKLQLRGLSYHRITLLKEHFTSKRCSKCGSRKTERPCQSFFQCRKCGYQQNADINTAWNIAFKLISKLIATGEMTSDQWSKNTRALLWAQPKASAQVGVMAAISTASSKDDTSSLVDSVVELAINESDQPKKQTNLKEFLP